jgi:transcriptional regulator with XRE-family HTH domain
VSDTAQGPLGFSARLRGLREARSITQAALAHAIGSNPSSVSQWELGTAYPAFWNLVELTRYFGVDMDWFTGMPYVRNELQQRTKVREIVSASQSRA